MIFGTRLLEMVELWFMVSERLVMPYRICRESLCHFDRREIYSKPRMPQLYHLPEEPLIFIFDSRLVGIVWENVAVKSIVVSRQSIFGPNFFFPVVFFHDPTADIYISYRKSYIESLS